MLKKYWMQRSSELAIWAKQILKNHWIPVSTGMTGIECIVFLRIKSLRLKAKPFLIKEYPINRNTRSLTLPGFEMTNVKKILDAKEQ